MEELPATGPTGGAESAGPGRSTGTKRGRDVPKAMGKHGKFMGKHGKFMGKHGKFMGKHGKFMGKHGKFMGKHGKFMGKHVKLMGTYGKIGATHQNSEECGYGKIREHPYIYIYKWGNAGSKDAQNHVQRWDTGTLQKYGDGSTFKSYATIDFSIPMTDPWCWYINANIKGVY